MSLGWDTFDDQELALKKVRSALMVNVIGDGQMEIES